MTKKHYDAIIVLGKSLGSNNSLSDNDQERLKSAARLFNDEVASAIIVCGAYGYKQQEKPTVSQAEAYANYLENLGIPREQIYQETTSQETLGNLLFTKTELLLTNNWHNLLVIPTYDHSTERIIYLLQKTLGDTYSWDVLRVGESTDQANKAREEKSLRLTKDINDHFADGDHESICAELMNTHPAYGGSKWTIDELRQKMKH